MFLMILQRSLKSLQQTLQQDLEEMGSKRDRKGPSKQQAADHQPFTVCLGLLLKSAEVSLLLKPVPQPECSTGSPLGSELSPSESHGTLEPGVEGVEKGSEGGASGSGGVAAKGPSSVDQLLCGEGSDGGGGPKIPTPLVPLNASPRPEFNHRGSLEERTPAKNSSRWNSEEGGDAAADAAAGGEGAGSDVHKAQSESLAEPLRGKNCNDKDSSAAAKMPQSISRYPVCLFVRIWRKVAST